LLFLLLKLQRPAITRPNAPGAAPPAVAPDPSATGFRHAIAPAVFLFLYAAPFSFAYLAIGAGIGALVLFGAVQSTMIGWAIFRGHRGSPSMFAGLAAAIVGLVVLVPRGKSAPNLLGIALMAIAGVAWGVYSLGGRGIRGNPLRATARNFALATPLGLVPLAFAAVAHDLHATARGATLAAISGAVASGVGYSFWYAALRAMTATRAAVLQALVPILAAIGGIVLLGEAITFRFVVALVLVLGGVALALRAR